ncbi:MAG: hypothetical protein K0S44_775 [Bacteroidetes bacterium]|jgi:hypothetical protein|nr:hypothetical protein [Bacteroidota bacterium]
MKDLENFRYLPIKEKADILSKEAKIICSLKSHGLVLTLYCYNKHFVEVFNDVKTGKLVGVRILEDMSRLRFYARNLDLNFLLGQSLLGFAYAFYAAQNELLKMAC